MEVGVVGVIRVAGGQLVSPVNDTDTREAEVGELHMAVAGDEHVIRLERGGECERLEGALQEMSMLSGWRGSEGGRSGRGVQCESGAV